MAVPTKQELKARLTKLLWKKLRHFVKTREILPNIHLYIQSARTRLRRSEDGETNEAEETNKPEETSGDEETSDDEETDDDEETKEIKKEKRREKQHERAFAKLLGHAGNKPRVLNMLQLDDVSYAFKLAVDELRIESDAYKGGAIRGHEDVADWSRRTDKLGKKVIDLQRHQKLLKDLSMGKVSKPTQWPALVLSGMPTQVKDHWDLEIIVDKQARLATYKEEYNIKVHPRNECDIKRGIAWIETQIEELKKSPFHWQAQCSTNVQKSRMLEDAEALHEEWYADLKALKAKQEEEWDLEPSYSPLSSYAPPSPESPHTPSGSGSWSPSSSVTYSPTSPYSPTCPAASSTGAATTAAEETKHDESTQPVDTAATTISAESKRATPDTSCDGAAPGSRAEKKQKGDPASTAPGAAPERFATAPPAGRRFSTGVTFAGGKEISHWADDMPDEQVDLDY